MNSLQALTMGALLIGPTGCAAPVTPTGPVFAPAPGSPFVAGSSPGRPVVADFNADGKPDLALACGSSPAPRTGKVLILLNDGSGRFTAGPGVSAGPHVDTIAVADFNADGKPDIAAVEHDSYSVQVFLGDGRGGLSAAPGSPFAAFSGARPHTHDVAAADINADGHVDIMTTNAEDDGIAVLLGDGRGGFTPAPGSPFAAERHPYTGLVIRDLNGDGKPDAVAPLMMSRGIGVYFGDGAGGFSPAPDSPLRVGERPGFTLVDDVDRDGRPDILATHDDVGMLDVFLNTGGGRFRAAPGSPVRVGRPAWSVATADFDGDGHTDALLSSQGRGRPTLLLGDGRGGFRESGVELPTGDEPNYVLAADLNGDGKPDIVTSNFGSGDVTVLLSR